MAEPTQTAESGMTDAERKKIEDDDKKFFGKEWEELRRLQDPKNWREPKYEKTGGSWTLKI